ncbi:MAG: glycosyltransferase [Planctomycetes bacterium]|nr:glycosyltransferase [Planctomycetota bacterium]
MDSPRFTVVVPNWNSGPMLRLCLASVARFTTTPHRVLVVDNRSTDPSRQAAEEAAARGLVRLVTREDAKNDGAADHGAALDLGLSLVDTPLAFTLDSDAWARRPGWHDPWLQALEAEGASHAGATKFPGGRAQRLWAWLRGRQPGPEARYVRPCHALYRVDLLRAHGLSFAPATGPDGASQTVGERLHHELLAQGHRAALLPHPMVEAHVGHLRHTSFVLNPARFPALRRRARRRGERQVRRVCASAEARAILEGGPLDVS